MKRFKVFPIQRIISKTLPLYFLSFFLICQISLGLAQKPKLGLVLSGGGAKGIAHIGVLKSMEAAGIKPDYITGTSMGSIIGGLYAMGYNADQIEQIVSSIDWDLILSNNIPMDYISYEEKEYYNRFLIELPVKNGKIALPSGLIEGQMLSEALNHYTWPAMRYDHFDDLPIPFRCIATDVSTGKQIIFKDGSLAEAMRASMAIPTAFTAADLDSTLAVDGGVVNNFPSDVLKEMGADIIIGVNVTKGFKSSDEVNTMTAILLQMSMLSSNEKLPERAAICDLYLQPDLSEYSTASFNKYDEILKIGEDIGREFSTKFDSIAEVLGVRNTFPGTVHDHDEIIISDIELSGNKLFGEDLIMGKLGINQGDTVDPVEVEEGVRTVFGVNGFKKVEYRMTKSSETESMNLKLKMGEKPPTALRASFHYDNTFSAGIVLNLQFRDIFLKSSRTIFAGDISENPKFRFDYYKYTGVKKKVALNIRYDYLNEQLPIYAKGEKIDVETDIENSIQVNVLTTQSLKSSFLLGYNFESNRFKSEFSSLFPQGVDFGDLSFSRIVFGYTRNTLNNQNYPTKGTERFIRFNGYFNNTYKAKFKNAYDSVFFNFPKDSLAPLYFTEDQANAYLKSITPGVYGSIYLRSVDFINIARNFQFIPYVSLGLIASVDSTNAIFNEFIVGGHQQVKNTDTKFIGLNYGEKNLENFLIGGLFFQNVVKKNFFIQYGANVLTYHDHLPIFDVTDIDVQNAWENNTLLGYGGKITYRSYVGPISLGISSNTDDGYIRYYLSIGFSFNYSD